MKAGVLGIALVLVCALAVFPTTSGLASSAGQDRLLAPGVEPLNTTAASAATLVPDGSSVTQPIGAEIERWYAARVEAGKSYVFEAMQSGRDRTSNDISVQIFENDGVTTFQDNWAYDGDTNSAAPSMQASSTTNVTWDGVRCAMSLLTTSPAKLVLFRVYNFWSGTPVMVRMRETTIYGRYSVNGYNMFVAVHNPSATPVAGFVVYWPENTTTNTSSNYVGFESFSLPGYGSTQFTRSAGAFAAPGNRGQVRVYMTSGTDVHVQLYAFNPTANNYLFFQPSRANGGNGNSW